MKKTIKDFELQGKQLIIRVDFNVPIKDGKITDDNRIIESLPTINYAIEKGAKIILMSHLGRVKSEEDIINNSLFPVAERLSELLEKDVTFVNATKGEELELAVNNLNNGDVLLVENTRYEDLDGEKESTNDPELGAYWASLGEIYINDAFGTSHRSHASNVGIASKLPNGVGFLIEKELNALEPAINNPERPFIVILGGAKVKDKIQVIENLVRIADYILIGGGMSYTFLKAKGLEIGKSLLDEENVEFCKRILTTYADKVILPIDVGCAKEFDPNAERIDKLVTAIQPDEMGMDMGPATIKLFKQYLDTAKTVIWNGPVGVFEFEKFAVGTIAVCETLAKLDATTIIGGGDSASAAINLGFKEDFTHIATGGGASLELLEGKKLPGIEIIDEKGE